MARTAQPWWREDRKGWYVTLNGKRHFLGSHPKDAPRPRKGKTGWNPPEVIRDAFNELRRTSTTVSHHTVAAILDDFIEWCKENRAKKTTDRYLDFCQSFVTHCGRMSVSQLNTAHVTAWLSENDQWNSTTKRNALTAIQRAFNWAVRNRGLQFNPIRGMEKPKAKRRTNVVTPTEFDELLSHVKDQQFRDLLFVSYDSGIRPQEIKVLSAQHMQLDKSRAVIPGDEAKGEITRVVYFPTERCMEIVRRLTGEGLLFRNTRGVAWTAYSIKCRFHRLAEKTGKRITHYTLRHSFITRKLLAGVDSHVVAKLSGHTDTKMIDSVYSHVADDYGFMLEQAKKDLTPNEDSSDE